MTFRKYDHVERFGHDEVQEIDLGTVHVFPKLDGTNASVWSDDGMLYRVRAASRNRELSLDKDNAGFFKWCQEESYKRLRLIFEEHPNWRLYGEWLVPHTLKTYREDVWNRFWVFDVHDGEKYIPFEEYHPVLVECGFDVIEPLCTYTNPTEEQLRHEVDTNFYLLNDGAGVGEGIVIKNYKWTNQYGRQPWAKIVRNEFKEENKRAFGVPDKKGKIQVESVIAEEFVTSTLVNKTLAKIEQDCLNFHNFEVEDQFVSNQMARRRAILEGERNKIIPQLLERVYYELVNEELWTALKKHKFPVIDFKKLRSFSVLQTKKYAGELF